jgi:SAM-dependent methyltransferase
MVEATTRVERERQAHNQGLKRGTYDRLLNPAKYFFREDRLKRVREIFLAHPNAKVLELGSTTWHEWIESAGLSVRDLTCINISERELEHGRNLAATTRNKPNFLLMDANNLQFSDSSFDIVYGAGILHHLDYERALSEVARVLKPGGVIVFAEPLDINPVGRIVRWLTPKARTKDERPLRRPEIKLLYKYFKCNLIFEGMFSIPVSVLVGALGMHANNKLLHLMYFVDRALLRLPGIRLWGRYLFIEGQKR